ncbi:LruC domain-containing protein [Vibrio rhodolitus]|uniref:LruC domain-containing protein n=1 Tax=Vibrio rhodolitus TaxID=2231649 RepID=UPI000E0C67E6|nr:LruC domain-containing protein [Vibrio rhodolitus]
MPTTFSKLGLISLTASSFALSSVSYAQQPFNNCPTEAFLIQNPSGTPVAYGVDIDLGSYRTLDSTLGSAKLNGVGFSQHDNFIYGWDYGAKSLARIDGNFEKFALSVTKPSGVPSAIYVGDVSLDENAWYGYRPADGLFKVDLDTMQMSLVANKAQFGSPSIFDIAFHPDNSFAYSIDSSGYLWQIDVGAGTSTRLNQLLDKTVLGFSLTFGAVYFDVDGNFYASNNSNGYVYKVAINGMQSSANFFAYGPSSNSNDGARCALAPVEASPNTDFGDAPDSYNTAYDNSGARHGITTLMLGSVIDGETDASLPPLSDDVSDGVDDEDGIAFPLPVQVGRMSKIKATVSGATSGSVLNAWIDFDGDGSFESDEQIISDSSMSNGEQDIFFSVPPWAQTGSTWARFRLSEISGIGPSGGVPTGEVEDYQIDITEEGVVTEVYPSGADYTTFAYEDQYPIAGDYDMNDVLMNVKYTEYQLDGKVIRLKFEGQIAALGGARHSGFAIRLPDVAPSDVRDDLIELTINNQVVSATVLESGTTDAVLIIHEDLWDITEAGEAEACTYFRTQQGCGTSYRPTWQLTVTMRNAIDNSQMPAFPYDPFIFASPGHYYGDIGYQLTGGYPGRGLEIHLKNKAPTSKFDVRYKALGDDTSSGDTHFHSANGLPWGIEIPLNWQHPLEQVNILKAYRYFATFAADPSGQTAPTWYAATETEKDNRSDDNTDDDNIDENNIYFD